MTERGGGTEEYFRLVKKSPLFYGINDDGLYTSLGCCAAEQIAYENNEYIFRVGGSVNGVVILLKGRARAIRESFWGRQELIHRIRKGGLFGEPCSCVRAPVLSVSATTKETCKVLFLNYQRVVTLYPLACEFHIKSIRNMLHLVSEHNVRLEGKLEHVCRETTGEKLLSYLSEQVTARGGRDFDIPHNRQELAEYLCADHSAMSSELSKMRNEGILDFQENHFVLHDRYDGGCGEDA